MITAIYSGCDWHDASVTHLILPAGMAIEDEEAAWQQWYRDTYCPALKQRYLDPPAEPPAFKSLIEWLIERGAVAPDESQLVEHWHE